MNKFVITLGLLLAFNSQATMLIKAVNKENVVAVKSLVALGANVDKKNEQDHFPLMAAAANGNTKIATILLKAGATVDLADNSGVTSLQVATFKNLPFMISVLLEAKADPNLADGAGQTPLLIACRNQGEDDAAMEKLLLDAGANPNLGDFMKRTPLMAAALEKKMNSFDLLLSRGAAVNARDKNQKSVLSYAEESESFKNILLKKGAIPYRIEELNFLWDIQFSETNKAAFKNYRNEIGDNHLIMAIKRQETLAVAPLIELGFNPNAQDKSGKAAIHWATLENDLEAVLTLIEARAKLRIVDNDGVTAFEYALMEGHVEIAAILAIAILNEELE